MTEAQFYKKMSVAVMEVKVRMTSLSHERRPSPEDYTRASIDAYIGMHLNLFPIVLEEGSIVQCIGSIASNPVTDPIIAATVVVYYMRLSWEYYTKNCQ